MKNKILISIDEQDSIENNIFLKPSIHDVWGKATSSEVLSSRKASNEPLTKEEKKQQPVFGFNKQVGSKSNKQEYPCRYLILELDTPGAQKKKINEGCRRTDGLVKAKFSIWYSQFLHAPDINYYWMYLTPSMRGLRFVIKTDRPVQNEYEYKEAVKQFLRVLYRTTNGAINTDHFDILVNQGWYVPTFEDYFIDRKMIFKLQPFKEMKSEAKKSTSSFSSRNNSVANKELSIDDRFIRAMKITENKFSYIEGQRNHFIYYLACNCNRFAIPQSETYGFLLANFDLEESEIRQSTQSAYKQNLNEFGKFLTS